MIFQITNNLPIQRSHLKEGQRITISQSWKTILEYIKTNPKEVETLSKDFLISVTSFFRDKESFDFIQTDVVLPDILEKTGEGEDGLKLWVAGCATGEEAYSLAILIHEQLTGNYKDTIVKIFATDIDTTPHCCTQAKGFTVRPSKKMYLLNGLSTVL